MRRTARTVEIMDTTLRDGEQTPDVAYTPAEKLQLARMLLAEVGVDRIEIGSGARLGGRARGGAPHRALGARAAACSRASRSSATATRSSRSTGSRAVGGRVMNLLVKGSERHCRTQLRVDPREAPRAVAQTVRYARQRKRLRVNVYLEDWSNGVRDSFDYVFAMVKLLRELGVERIYLADTLGVFTPADDAPLRRADGLHLARRALRVPRPQRLRARHRELPGRRARRRARRAHQRERHGRAHRQHAARRGRGRAPRPHRRSRTGVDESRLVAVSRLVETFSGKDVAANTPIVGRDVFTQTAGIHADGDAKGDLYASRLAPKRFGQQRRYALGKLSGKASLDHNLKALGIELRPRRPRAGAAAHRRARRQEAHRRREDLPYIIADVLKTPEQQLVRVESYAGDGRHRRGAAAPRWCWPRGKRRARASASGDGGYDAFMNALRKAARRLGLEVPQLADFRVRIPPGGRTAALVETVITWQSRARGARASRRSASTRTSSPPR